MLRFSPDGKFLVSGSDDHQLKVWDLRQGCCIETKLDHGGAVNDIRFHPCEMMFASGGADRQVNFYDFQSFERVSYSNPTTHAITTIKFNIDGSALFFNSGEVIREIEWEPYKLIRSWVSLKIIAAKLIIYLKKVDAIRQKWLNGRGAQ